MNFPPKLNLAITEKSSQCNSSETTWWKCKAKAQAYFSKKKKINRYTCTLPVPIKQTEVYYFSHKKKLYPPT